MSPRKRTFYGLIALVIVLVAVLGARALRPDTRVPEQRLEPSTLELPIAKPSTSESRAEQPHARALDELAQRDPAATVLVEGVVVDSLGGPIEGAELSARQQAIRDALPVAFAQSDEHGRFALWVRPGRARELAGLLWIHAHAHGYAESTVVVRTPARAVRVSLFPESRLAGVVVTESGEPVPGVIVELRPPPLSLLPVPPRTKTNAQGQFELRNLAPGRYLPFVDDGQWFGKLERIELGLLERREDLRIVVTAGFAVQVDVRAPDGSPCLAPRARFHGLERDGSKRDADGLVLLAAVPRGEHRLIGACEGALEAEQIVEINADSIFTITTVEGQAILGRVLDDRGDPVAGARIVADSPRTGHAHDLLATESDEHGEFELRGLAPGRFDVHASRSDRLGGEPVAVDLRHGEDSPFVELRLERGQCVRGGVEGGPDPLVVVAGLEKRPPTNLQLPSDRRFEICGFAPTEVGVLMLEDPGARVRIPFVSEAATVVRLPLQFPDAGEHELELHVTAAADRSLLVRVEGDALIELSTWQQSPPSKPPSKCSGRPFPIEVIAQGVSEDGELTLEGLWPGSYIVHADLDEGHRCAFVEIRDQPTLVDLR